MQTVLLSLFFSNHLNLVRMPNGPITYSEHPKSCSEFDEKPNDRLSRCWPKYTLPSQSAEQFSHFVIQEKEHNTHQMVTRGRDRATNFLYM